MTFYAKTGHWNNTTSGTSDTISGLGFTPVALILWGTNQGTTGWQALQTHNVVAFGMGFAAANGSGPTMQYGATCNAQQDHSSSLPSQAKLQDRHQAAYPYILYDHQDNLLLQISSVAFSSLNSGQFVATYSTTPGTAYTIYYLAIGGSDITGAGVTGWKKSSGNQGVTLAGTSFKPNVVLHLSDCYTSAPPAKDTSYGMFMLGAMSATSQWAIHNTGSYEALATNSQSSRTQVTNACILNVATMSSPTGGNTITDVASFVSMDSGGFTVDWTTDSGNDYYYYSLALAGTNIKVGAWAKTGQTSAITDTVTGVGFTPSAVLAATDSYPASASNIQSARITVGASDGTNFSVAAKTDESNVGSSVDSNYNDSTNSIIVSNSTAGDATDVAAPINNFLSDKFDIVWGTDATTDATQICYIAIGPAIANVTMPSVTATVSPTANVSLIGVAPSDAGAAVISPVLNVPLVGVGPPGMTTVVSPSANVSLPGVKPPDVTSSVAPVLNVPLVGVAAAPITAAANPTANIPLPDVWLVPASPAVISPVLNVPLIGVDPPDVTALIGPSACVPIINVTASPLTAIVGPLANAPLPDVTLDLADSAVISPTANAEDVGVEPPAMTAIVNVRANVPQLIWAYRHQRDVLVIRSDPRCMGLFTTHGKRCVGMLANRGSRNVGLLEIDITKDT